MHYRNRSGGQRHHDRSTYTLCEGSHQLCKTQVVILGHSQPQWKFGAYGKAYHQAARQALARLRRKATIEGSEACPAIFLYRHAVELYLKSVVHVGKIVFLMSGRQDPPLTGNLLKTHRLDRLISTVSIILKEIGVRPHSIVPGVGMYSDLKKIIHELNEVDELSDAFRYPVDTTGTASVPKGTTLNVERFGMLMDCLLSYVEQCVDFLTGKWQDMVAAHARAESEGKEGEWAEIDLSTFNPRK